uniref:Uncharacterized protein n=1 Tax=Arion vulgaris TaxID=1028688 RepID=A0A0B7C253_9EUPU
MLHMACKKFWVSVSNVKSALLNGSETYHVTKSITNKFRPLSTNVDLILRLRW